VASVARRPRVDDGSACCHGSAPLASLHDVLGASSPSPRGAVTGASRAAAGTTLGIIFLTALLAEWLLRRMRGAR
jgi:hypothetical protein